MTDSTGHRNPNEVADALSAYWDAFVGGDSADDAGAAGGLVDMVGRLQASDTAPKLSAEQRTQLWEEIMATPAPNAGSLRRSSRGLPGANGNVPGLTVSQSGGNPRWSRVNSRPGWVLAQVATAALLLVTLGFGYVAFGPGRSHPASPGMLPVLLAPEATRVPALTADETLLDLPIPTEMIPRRVAPGSGFIHYILPPGTTTTWDSPALHVEYVISGTYTVRSDGLMQIVAAGEGGEPTSIPSGTEITLGPGDAMIAPKETTSTYTTSGSDPVELLFWEVNEGDEAKTDPTPRGWATHDVHLHHQPPLPLGAGRLRLQRIELAAEEALSPPPDTLQLAVTLPKNAAGTRTPSYLVQRSADSIRNSGPTPITVYVITLEPAAAGMPTP